MRLLLAIGALALASALICAHSASAFTVYQGGVASSGSGYADPDDQVRSYLGLGPDMGHDRSYDRGTMPAQNVIVNQGVLSPDWYFKRSRR
jgi:hypothetical protein